MHKRDSYCIALRLSDLFILSAVCKELSLDDCDYYVSFFTESPDHVCYIFIVTWQILHNLNATYVYLYIQNLYYIVFIFFSFQKALNELFNIIYSLLDIAVFWKYPKVYLFVHEGTVC